MAAYYNEIDPYAAQWLRNLIAAGHIAPGDVDERSIEDVHPDDLKPYTQCHFFAGIGVWSLALRCAGWPDDRPVWTGSCPCQPFSKAGPGLGFADERHLWPAWHHLIRERRPTDIIGEQVADGGGLAWIDLVQADLEAEGYAFGAFDLCSAGFGAPHIRQRLWIVANANDTRLARRGGDPLQRGGKRAVVNPAEHGIIEGYEWADYMKLDIPQLITCDTVALLPDWRQSKGVRLEHHIACELGIIRINAADIREPAREAVPA